MVYTSKYSLGLSLKLTRKTVSLCVAWILILFVIIDIKKIICMNILIVLILLPPCLGLVFRR